jgi:hypothetical protein
VVNSVGLSAGNAANVSMMEPATPGQFVIGTFTANATSQDVTYISGEVNGVVNGFQLRNVTPVVTPAGVPDTGGTLAMLGLALLGLGAFNWNAARLQKVALSGARFR